MGTAIMKDENKTLDILQNEYFVLLLYALSKNDKPLKRKIERLKVLQNHIYWKLDTEKMDSLDVAEKYINQDFIPALKKKLEKQDENS